MTGTIVKDINLWESSRGFLIMLDNRLQRFADPRIITKTVSLTVERDSVPENKLRMSHLAKYRGTPEMVRLTFLLA